MWCKKLSLKEDPNVDPFLPLVSIGLPTYGRPEGLRRILGQLVDQTYANLEIIVSDNCHPNVEGFEIAKKMAECDNRIKVYRQQENIGPILNHEFVKKVSHGDYFMWLGDDDEIKSNYVEECIKVISSDSTISLVGGVGHRYLNGSWWYDYIAFDTGTMNTKDRLKTLSSYAFNQQWLFEHYWYGIFRVDRSLTVISPYAKRLLQHFFALAESGRIVHCSNAELIKHTTQAELDNYGANDAYKKGKLLSMLRGKSYDNLQQCLPIYFQMCKIIIKSKNLSLLEKLELLFTISARLIKGPCRKELALYSPLGGLRHFCARVQGGLKRRLKKVLYSFRLF